MRYLLIILFLFNLLNAELIKPENLDTLSTIHVLFEWNQQPDAIAYNIQISHSNNFNDLLLDSISNDLILIDKANLDWNNQYFWRVKPIYDSISKSSWLGVSSFYIGDSKFNNGTYDLLLNEQNDNEDLIIFGGWYSSYNIVLDKFGREIWNSGDGNKFIVDVNKYGNLLGFEYNKPTIFNFNNNILFQYSEALNRHDFLNFENNKFMLLENHTIDGPIPIGPWTEIFQSLGYQADGETIEFPWSGPNILVIDENGNNLWEWDVFNHFNMNEYDSIGGTWFDAYHNGLYDYTHSNSIFFDEYDNSIYLSSRNLSRITKISYPEGNIIWNMGLSNQFGTGNNNICTELEFTFQHDFKKLENGNFLIFDNGNLSEIVRETDNPQTRFIEFEINDELECNIVHECSLPDLYYSFSMGSVDLLSNGNYLINTRGNNAHILEITPQCEIIFDAYLRDYNHPSSLGNYRTFTIPSIHPDAFSLQADNFTSVNNENIVQVIDNQINFKIYNHSNYTQNYSYNFTDLTNQMFNNEQDEFSLNPNEYIILSFNVNDSEVDITEIMFNVTPIYHEYATKHFLFKVSNSNLSNTTFESNFKLNNIYPNPFNPTTTIEYNVPNFSKININIYNINGQLIEVLTNKMHQPGIHNINWHAQEYTSGIYFVKLTSEEFIATQKIILIK